MIERSDTNRELPGQMYSVGSNRRARLLREEKIGRPTAFRKLTAQRFDEKHFEGVNTFSGKALNQVPVPLHRDLISQQLSILDEQPPLTL